MKILTLNHEFPPLGGGASPVTRDLAINLTKNAEIKIDLVTMNFKRLPIKESLGGLTIYRVPAFRSKKEICKTHEMLSYILSAAWKAIGLIKKTKYDLVHAHFIVPSGIVAYVINKLYRIPYIISSHGSDVPGFNPDRFVYLHRLIQPVWNLVVNNCCLIIVPTRSFKERLHKLSKKIIVIPHGFTVDKINLAKNKQNQILMVSRLLKRKGFQHVLKALASINTNYRIKIVGEGPFKKELLRLSKELKIDVTFTGWLESENLYKQYSESKIFILPSLSESFGMVLVEAMASNCAVIYGGGSSGEEVVGKAGLAVEPENVMDIKEKLLHLLQNEEKITNYGRIAQEKIKKDYLWPKISNLYITAYKSILK